jgi:membrane protein required for colicin V production
LGENHEKIYRFGLQHRETAPESKRMNLADVFIVAVLVVSVVSAFAKGFFLEVCSLAGVVIGLSFAGANYSGLAPLVLHLVPSREVADLIAFLVIALVVMVLAGMVGRALRGLVRHVGLGIVDRIFGAVFGLVKGCIVVTLVLMGIVAFLPRQQWLDSSRLAPVFLTAAHGGSHVVPFELGEKIREGLQSLRMAQPSLLKPSSELICDAAGSCPGSSGIGCYESNTNPAVERVGKRKRIL